MPVNLLNQWKVGTTAQSEENFEAYTLEDLAFGTKFILFPRPGNLAFPQEPLVKMLDNRAYDSMGRVWTIFPDLAVIKLS